MSKSKYTTLVHEVRVLIGRSNHCLVDVYVKLQKIEKGGEWKEGAHATFAAFIRAEFPTWIGAHRYARAMLAIKQYGEAAVRKHGLGAMTGAAIEQPFQESALMRSELMESLDQVFETNGCPADAARARAIAVGIAPEIVKPSRPTAEVRRRKATALELETLREELAEVEAARAALEAEVRRLEAIVARYKKAHGDLPAERRQRSTSSGTAAAE